MLKSGFYAYAVGGCVRDSLLGRTPNDWDLTTNARPEEILACFPDRRTMETGRRHGTITVLWEGEPLEITTYRRDGAYADNRHPVQVTFSDTVETTSPPGTLPSTPWRITRGADCATRSAEKKTSGGASAVAWESR